MDTVTKGHLLLMKLTYYAIPVLGLAIILVAQPSSCNAQPRKIQLSHAGSYIAQASALDFIEQGVKKGNSGDYMGAFEDFTQAIKLEPDSTRAYKNRG